MAKTQSDAVEQAAQPEAALDYYLVVRHAFEDYRKGDAIRGPGEVARVLAGNPHNVHKVAA
ncbi:hypothetical protein [Trinickia sp.]|uniref:hypothetical protein n=1 Tax=Trinickia sp. TaxID=2571163 RepID=UPI003F7DAC8D